MHLFDFQPPSNIITFTSLVSSVSYSRIKYRVMANSHITPPGIIDSFHLPNNVLRVSCFAESKLEI